MSISTLTIEQLGDAIYMDMIKDGKRCSVCLDQSADTSYKTFEALWLNSSGNTVWDCRLCDNCYQDAEKFSNVSGRDWISALEDLILSIESEADTDATVEFA